LIYDYEGDVIDFAKVTRMKYRKSQLDGDDALSVHVWCDNGNHLEFKAAIKYNRVKIEVDGSETITKSEYPLQKLKRMVNSFKQYKNRMMIVDRKITRENNNENVHEEIIYE